MIFWVFLARLWTEWQWSCKCLLSKMWSLLDICWVSHMVDLSVFLKILCTNFQSGGISFQSYQKWMGLLLSIHSWEHALSVVFFILAILVMIQWMLKVGLICISVIFKDWTFLKNFIGFFFLFLRILYLDLLSIFNGIFFFRFHFFFYIFWIKPCQIFCSHRFPLTSCTCSSLKWLFPLLCGNISVFQGLIC